MIEIAEAVREDPLLFGRAILGQRFWKAQRDLSRAVDLHQRINIRSANGVGKTFWAGCKIVEMMITNPGSRTICTGPSFDQVEAGLWQEVKRAYASASATSLLGGRMLDNSWELEPGWDAAVINPKNISSAHGRRGRRVFVWVDEAQGVESFEYWTALDSLCQSPESRIIALFNPLWPQGKVFENSSNPDWHNMKISGFDHPNVRSGRELIPGGITRDWIAKKKEEWGEDDPKYIARVLGEFPDAGERQLIPLRLLEQCSSITPDVRDYRRAGLDCARNPGGGDKNAMVILDEHRQVILAETWVSDDTMYTAGKFGNALVKYGVDPRKAAVDVVGIGGGVVDRLRERGMRVIAVSFGESPKGGWKSLLGKEAIHLNLKAELHDAMRQLFRQKLMSVPKVWRHLWGDLTELRFTHDGSGRMKIEDKEGMKARIGRSPDLSDALAIALYNDEFRAPTDAELRALGR